MVAIHTASKMGLPPGVSIVCELSVALPLAMFAARLRHKDITSTRAGGVILTEMVLDRRRLRINQAVESAVHWRAHDD